jgi:hypothetical protein
MVRMKWDSRLSTCKRFSKSAPFKENGKLLKLCCLILQGLKLPVGSDTLQNKILRGSDPAEQNPARFRPRRTRSCGVWDPEERVSDPAEQWQRCVFFVAAACSAGSVTLQNNVLQGLILRLTKSCGVSDPAEQSSAGYYTPGNNFKYKYFRKFETELKNILGCAFGDYMGSIHGKN